MPLPLLDPLLDYLDWAGVAVFALSGALVAAAKRQTLVTFIFFAVVTGVGGGTARDLLIGAPVFWMHQNATLLICAAAALIVWIAPARDLARPRLALARCGRPRRLCELRRGQGPGLWRGAAPRRRAWAC